ncbi:mechanosensitive ion channel family protein [Acetobacter senegalensis]|uniref:mechanosensitive ion channel family protein n=1 Tax=Acetobacter senegalensis TaxID=446692 RepID=UPI0026517E3E|nr:mechanosensitive ion channel family protein [Acetobacter senegalensis]MDN7356187.1 mechanosensitive ion channel family protein [Acetobacter senegalensis]
MSITSTTLQHEPMAETIQTKLTPLVSSFRTWLSWLPPSLVSLLVLALIGLCAALLSRLVTDRILMRIPGAKRGAFVRSFTRTMRRPVRLTVVILAMSVALPACGLRGDLLDTVAHLLLMSFVAVMGLGTLLTTRVISDAYLVRFAEADQDDDILARKHATQVRLLRRVAEILICVLTVSAELITFEPVREYGLSLFASAGAASLIAGLAARPILVNLFAGVQIAMTQPIRMGDLIAFQGDWTWVEEITSTYVVLRSWDWRRRIVPIAYFLDTPFENWTYNSAELIGAVYLHVDYRAPMDRIRAKLEEIVRGCPQWTGKDFSAQVADCTDQTMIIRVTASARTAIRSWDLRCEIREKIIRWMCDDCPEALPRNRFAMTPTEQGALQAPFPTMDHPAMSNWPAGVPKGPFEPFDTPPAPSKAASQPPIPPQTAFRPL